MTARRPALAPILIGCLCALPLLVSLASGAPGISGSTHLAPPDDPGLSRLAAEIERLAEPAAGVVGVGVHHLESGRSLVLEAGIAFPMASTYKVPIAVEVLSRVDARTLGLDDLVTIETDDIVDTHGPIRDYLFIPGAQLTIRNLLELMLRASDNIATDLLFEVAGGGEVVTARMVASGVDGIRVDRTTRWIIANWLGRARSNGEATVPPAEFDDLVDAGRLSGLATDEVASLNRAFNADPRDTATPEAMLDLLRGIWAEEILSSESSRLLLDIMYRCRTGEARLKGALPAGTRVAHKTGTIGQTTNDVGIIELPGDAGHVVCVVFIKESELPSNEAMEPVIAEIARAVYDFFVLDPGRAP